MLYRGNIFAFNFISSTVGILKHQHGLSSLRDSTMRHF